MPFTVAYQTWLTYHNIVTSERQLSNIVLHIHSLHRYFTKWKLRANINKTQAILCTKHRPAFPLPLQFQHTAIPWNPHIRYLGLVLDSKLLFTKHLTLRCTQGHRYFSQTLSPPRPQLHTIPTQQTHPIQITDPPCTHAAPVWSNTSSANYRQLQILQSKCLRVIGNYPRRTPITHLHTALNLEPIHEFIYRLTDKFFCSCPTHPSPLVRGIGNYTVPDLHRQYRKYIHKRTKHLLL